MVSLPCLQTETYKLRIEIWPTCIVVPRVWRIALTIRGKDYEYEGEAATLSNMKNPMRGCGPFVHDDPTDRPVEVFGGKVTLHCGKGRETYLLLPVIPAKGRVTSDEGNPLDLIALPGKGILRGTLECREHAARHASLVTLLNELRRRHECGQPLGKKDLFCPRCGAKQPCKPKR